MRYGMRQSRDAQRSFQDRYVGQHDACWNSERRLHWPYSLLQSNIDQITYIELADPSSHCVDQVDDHITWNLISTLRSDDITFFLTGVELSQCNTSFDKMLDLTIRIFAIIWCVFGIAACACISERVLRVQSLQELPDAEKAATLRPKLRLTTTFDSGPDYHVQPNVTAWDIMVTKASILFTTITKQTTPSGLSKECRLPKLHGIKDADPPCHRLNLPPCSSVWEFPTVASST